MISKKVVLIGDFSTGKTSLIRRFVDNQFSDAYLSTIGVKISRKNILWEENEIQGLIWDIEGGTPMKAINRSYLLGAHGCIVVADITRPQTLESLQDYIEVMQQGPSQIPIVVALNKCDLIEPSHADEIAAGVKVKQNKIEELYLTSAKEGSGVEAMFELLGRMMIGEGE
ncbi:MAG: GTP-binding protein [Epsilonproteobacteria bacterium]|nr:MAG: GTP-binding protein [Campylobacterota bacterium]